MLDNFDRMYVSKTLKYYNQLYYRNYTLDDLADSVSTTRQTLVRLSGASSFDLVRRVVFSIYGFYQTDFHSDNLRYEVVCFDIMQRLIYGCWS